MPTVSKPLPTVPICEFAKTAQDSQMIELANELIKFYGNDLKVIAGFNRLTFEDRDSYISVSLSQSDQKPIYTIMAYDQGAAVLPELRETYQVNDVFLKIRDARSSLHDKKILSQGLSLLELQKLRLPTKP